MVLPSLPLSESGSGSASASSLGKIDKGVGISKVECGQKLSIILLSNGLACSCGVNEEGCLGIGEHIDETSVPMYINGGELKQLSSVRFCDVSVGINHCALLSRDGYVYTFGNGVDYKLGHGSEMTEWIPKCIESLKSKHSLKQLAEYESSTVAAALGSSSRRGGHRLKRTRSKSRKSSHKVVRIECGNSGTFAITNHGCVLFFGMESVSEKIYRLPFVLEYLREYRVYQLCCALDFTVALGVKSKKPVKIPDFALDSSAAETAGYAAASSAAFAAMSGSGSGSGSESGSRAARRKKRAMTIGGAKVVYRSKPDAKMYREVRDIFRAHRQVGSTATSAPTHTMSEEITGVIGGYVTVEQKVKMAADDLSKSHSISSLVKSKPMRKPEPKPEPESKAKSKTKVDSDLSTVRLKEKGSERERKRRKKKKVGSHGYGLRVEKISIVDKDLALAAIAGAAAAENDSSAIHKRSKSISLLQSVTSPTAIIGGGTTDEDAAAAADGNGIMAVMSPVAGLETARELKATSRPRVVASSSTSSRKAAVAAARAPMMPAMGFAGTRPARSMTTAPVRPLPSIHVSKVGSPIPDISRLPTLSKSLPHLMAGDDGEEEDEDKDEDEYGTEAEGEDESGDEEEYESSYESDSYSTSMSEEDNEEMAKRIKEKMRAMVDARHSGMYFVLCLVCCCYLCAFLLDSWSGIWYATDQVIADADAACAYTAKRLWLSDSSSSAAWSLAWS